MKIKNKLPQDHCDFFVFIEKYEGRSKTYLPRIYNQYLVNVEFYTNEKYNIIHENQNNPVKYYDTKDSNETTDTMLEKLLAKDNFFQCVKKL